MVLDLRSHVSGSYLLLVTFTVVFGKKPVNERSNSSSSWKCSHIVSDERGTGSAADPDLHLYDIFIFFDVSRTPLMFTEGRWSLCLSFEHQPVLYERIMK